MSVAGSRRAAGMVRDFACRDVGRLDWVRGSLDLGMVPDKGVVWAGSRHCPEAQGVDHRQSVVEPSMGEDMAGMHHAEAGVVAVPCMEVVEGAGDADTADDVDAGGHCSMACRPAAECASDLVELSQAACMHRKALVERPNLCCTATRYCHW